MVSSIGADRSRLSILVALAPVWHPFGSFADGRPPPPLASPFAFGFCYTHTQRRKHTCGHTNAQPDMHPGVQPDASEMGAWKGIYPHLSNSHRELHPPPPHPPLAFPLLFLDCRVSFGAVRFSLPLSHHVPAFHFPHTPFPALTCSFLRRQIRIRRRGWVRVVLPLRFSWLL